MKKIVIDNIRNIKHLEFNLPTPGTYILTGTNGSGKTTLFTCINRIRNSNAFRKGFPSSANKDLDNVTGAITYEVDGISVSYSRRSSGEWRPSSRNSNIFDKFGFPCVVNITTKNERIFTQEVIKPRQRKQPDIWLNENLNAIFNTNKFSNMIQITTGDMRRGKAKQETSRRRNIAYAIPVSQNKYFTEQNFSFGEIIIINLLHDIKNTPNGSLILIDELEMALHPSAQIKLLKILKELAKEKGQTIIISTHSSSIIRSERAVIFLDKQDDGTVEIIERCPSAKAIGAIGMREDTDPDIVVLVEDFMANAYFSALKQKYNEIASESDYLDIRILEIGGYQNVIHFFDEAKNSIFYDNVFLTAYLDNDVTTDVLKYRQYCDGKTLSEYDKHGKYINFLPYTPEILLLKYLQSYKNDIISSLKKTYSNQQLFYEVRMDLSILDYTENSKFDAELEQYSDYSKRRGKFRNDCKAEVTSVVATLSEQLNRTENEIYRWLYKFIIDKEVAEGFNIREYLAPAMKRLK